MLVRANLDGEEVLVQIVKRKDGTTYIRKFPMNPPTEKQLMARRRFALAAISAFGKPREAVVETVKRNMGPVSIPDNLNQTEKELSRYYPEVYQIVHKKPKVSARYPIPLKEEETYEHV